MNNIRNIAIFLLFAMMGFFACEEGERFGISSDDTTPPDAPKLVNVIPIEGGARIFYKIPNNRDVISIEASFEATNGKLVKSAVSFAAPFLEIFGLPDTLEHTVQLYALDRAGNKSENVPVTFNPLEPAYNKVAKVLTVKPSFGALLIDWVNDLKQDVIVCVDFTFSDNGTQRSVRQAYSSKLPVERHFINDLKQSLPVDVKFFVEDLYGNRSQTIDLGQLTTLADEVLDKSKWVLPAPGTLIDGKYMSCGDTYGGRTRDICDGLIDYLPPLGFIDNGPLYGYAWIVNGIDVNQQPWQMFIDLGDKYELSRIRTHQMWNPDDPPTAKATETYNFYRNGGGNVQTYNLYWWDGNDAATVGEWKLINQTRIPLPGGDMNITDILKQGLSGDEALMYPTAPGFTPATRYIRYEPVAGFIDRPLDGWGLSEITLYGRKATR
jgi:hypothetical protein